MFASELTYVHSEWIYFVNINYLYPPDREFRDARNCINNDILLKGKKFSGGECIHDKNIFEENIFITLHYFEEKEIFDKVLELDEKILTENFYDECAFKIFENFMLIWQQVLSDKFKQTSDTEERKQISAEIAGIISRLKSRRID